MQGGAEERSDMHLDVQGEHRTRQRGSLPHAEAGMNR
jgi:hypothetical protein